MNFVLSFFTHSMAGSRLVLNPFPLLISPCILLWGVLHSMGFFPMAKRVVHVLGWIKDGTFN